MTRTDLLIERLTAPLADADRAGLDELLADAVASGASVGYVDVPTPEEARDYWRGVESGVAAGTVMLFAARLDERLVGTVNIAREPKPNARHRGELRRLLVHSSTRNRGIGRRLVQHAEREARAAGMRLLMLDVRVNDPAERLYRTLGWQDIGPVPDYFVDVDGSFGTTLYMYRRLVD